MSLTSQQLVERALRRLPPQSDLIAARSRLLVLIPDALKSLALRVAEDGSGLLKKDFSLSVVSGSASLATPLTASEPMLLEYLKFARITSSESAQPWQFVPDYATLSLERPTFGMIHFTLVGQTLHATNTSGALGSLTTTGTAHSSYIPLLSSVSGNLALEEMLVEELAEVSAVGKTEAEAT